SAEMGVFQGAKYLRSKDVAPNDGLIRGRILYLRLFHEILNTTQAAVEFSEFSFYCFAINDSILRYRGTINLVSGDDGRLGGVKGLDHLLETWNSGIDHIIGEQDGEGLVADQFARHQHCMAEP